MPRKRKEVAQAEIALQTSKKKNTSTRQIQQAVKAEAIFDECMSAMTKGTFKPATLLALHRKHKTPIPEIRAIAAQASGLLRQLQELSDDPEEAKTMMKANMNEKLTQLLEEAQKNKDYKAANAIITTYGRLNNLFTPEGPQISNTIGIFSKFTDEELRHVRNGFDLPESVIADLENRK